MTEPANMSEYRLKGILVNMNNTYEDVVRFLQDFAEFDPEDIDMSSRMKEDLGLDSLTLITMVDEAERRFNIVIRDEQLMSIRTIGDVVRSIDEQTRS